MSRSTKKLTFRPIKMIPIIWVISHEMLEHTKDQLNNFIRSKDNPYMLDDQLINRSLKLHREHNHHTTKTFQQCDFWQTRTLNEIQLLQVEEIRISTTELINANNQIIVLLQYFKDNTIDKLFKKDDMELALDFFISNNLNDSLNN